MTDLKPGDLVRLHPSTTIGRVLTVDGLESGYQLCKVKVVRFPEWPYRLGGIVLARSDQLRKRRDRAQEGEGGEP